VVGSLFLLWRQRLKFLAKLSLFFKNNSPRFTLIFGERVASYGEISVNLCGDRHLASVATVQKWPNKKKRKRKRLVMGGTHSSFSSHRRRSSGACLNE